MKFSVTLKKHISPVSMIVFIIILAFWKLILFDAVIKWDIFDFQYPISIFISDSIRNFHLPLWNPYIYYGQPLFSQMGVPIWYPTTLFISLFFGYSIQALQIELVLHIVLSGLFTYLLCYSQFYKNRTVSLIIAISYALSGFFIGNAQHIMWVISATWFPLALYFILKGVRSRKNIHFVWAGVPFALIITGGYPGFLFVGYFISFIIISHLTFKESNDFYSRKESILKGIGFAVKSFGLLVITSALLGAISLLPFVETMKYMTRGALDYSVASSTHSLNVGSWLTFLFPSLIQLSKTIAPDVDISMINLYIGLLPLFFLPIAFIKARNSEAVFFGLLGVLALIASMGRYNFLYELLFKSVPFFDTFRFPSLYRYFAIIFLLIVSGFGVKYFLEKISTKRFIKTSSLIKVIFLGVSIWLILYIANYREYFTSSVIFYALQDTGLILLLLFMFLVITGRLQDGNLTLKNYKKGLILIVAINLLYSTYVNFYITVAEDAPGKKELCKNIEVNRERDFAIPQSILVRQKSPVNNLNVISKEFAAEGYNSYMLKDVNVFLTSKARERTGKNPLFYLTNNILTETNTQSKLDKINNESFQESRVIIDRLPKGYKLNGEKLAIHELDNTTNILSLNGNIDNNNLLLYLQIKSDNTNRLIVNFSFADSNYVHDEAINLIQDGQWHSYIVSIPTKGSNIKINLKNIDSQNLKNPQLLKPVTFSRKTDDIYQFSFKEVKLINDMISSGEKEITSLGDDPILELPPIKWISSSERLKYLVFDLKISKDVKGSGKIYYTSTPYSIYSEINSISFELKKDSQWNNYKIALPNKDIYNLRIDPYSSIGMLMIDNIKLIEEWTETPNGKIKIINFEPNRIVLDVQTPINQLLVTMQSHYPGWKAKVDNEPVDILRANVNFRAIPLEKGNHRVEMFFQPISFYLGLSITLLTCLMLFILLIRELIIYKKGESA